MHGSVDTAIHAFFFQTEIQNCIIHQIWNFSKYVFYKDLKELIANLKAIYTVVEVVFDALDASVMRWGKKYPKISQSWRANRTNLSAYFKFPRQLRKVTKAKSVFPTDDSLLKMLHLAMIDITRKRTERRQDWRLIHARGAIYSAKRISV